MFCVSYVWKCIINNIISGKDNKSSESSLTVLVMVLTEALAKKDEQDLKTVELLHLERECGSCAKFGLRNSLGLADSSYLWGRRVCSWR